MKRSGCGAARLGSVRLLGTLAGAFPVERDDGIHRMVVRIDLRQMRVEGFDGGDFALCDGCGQFDG